MEPVFAPIFVDQRTKVVNRFEAPVAVTVGDNNVVQQQGNGGSGATAQQQVATVRGTTSRGSTRGGGASNVVMSDGSIVQAAPGQLR